MDILESDSVKQDKEEFEPVTILKDKLKDTSFKEFCSHCKKKFKSKATYTKHVDQQLCFSSNELSYCKICDIKLDNHASYVKHIITMEHLNNIGCSKLERLNDNQPNKIFTADPYLNKNEASLIGTTNLGCKFTIVYENNETQVVNLARTSNIDIYQSKAEQLDNCQVPDKIIKPTPRQEKLLIFMESQTNTIDASNNFLKMINSKLSLEDYYGLTSIIRDHKRFKPEYRTAYLEMINKFVEALVKMKTAGQPVYKDKDISKLVIALTI
jgi:hypothetical protein